MFIKRDIYEKLEKEVKNNKITALVGPRQVGKTTLLKEIKKNLEKSIYITFDDRKILNLFEEDIDLFIDKYISEFDYIFIDEFQYAKQGGQKLKFIFDTIENKKIFISGSSNPELAIHSFQYLVGRISIIEIFPLTFREYLNYKSNEDSVFFKKIRKQDPLKLIKKYFEEYLKFGGFPDCVLQNSDEDKKKVLKNIVESYLFKEIKEILDYKNIYEFENVLKRVALQDCKILNKNSFSEDLGIEYRRLTEIFNTLDKTYLLFLLQPFLKNKIKEQIKSPKTIMLDLGLKNSLINNFNDLDLRVDKGEIYENFIFSQLIKMGLRTQFFNEQNRYEMDFVYEKDGEIVGIECKSKFKELKPNKSIIRFIETFKAKKVIVFNQDLDGEILYGECKIIFTNYLNVYNIENM